jgi:hypothetical protein
MPPVLWESEDGSGLHQSISWGQQSQPAGKREGTIQTTRHRSNWPRPESLSPEGCVCLYIVSPEVQAVSLGYLLPLSITPHCCLLYRRLSQKAQAPSGGLHLQLLFPQTQTTPIQLGLTECNEVTWPLLSQSLWPGDSRIWWLRSLCGQEAALHRAGELPSKVVAAARRKENVAGSANTHCRSQARVSWQGQCHKETKQTSVLPKWWDLTVHRGQWGFLSFLPNQLFLGPRMRLVKPLPQALSGEVWNSWVI